MKNTDIILTEMQSIAPSISAIGTAMPYSVDAQYFESLPEILLEQAQFADNHIISNLPYQVPPNYFDQLSTQLLNRIAAETTVEAPIQKTTAKIVRFNQVKRWMSYAAAAILAGILITNAFLFTDKPNYSEYEKYRTLDIPSTLDLVSDADLNNYIQNNSHTNGVEEMVVSESQALPNLSENMELLSNENLDAYLQENKLLEHTNFENPIK
ncbi:MAG: hypothetical protein D4R41_01565 [Sediminibacterium sp.]|nr:MAG: hypothetical protein D4R41_01565 [Sediminibacterium sp.]